ncbi:molybdopterin-dependent oxidoreductase [Lapillicoccus jejuensis]|uniref:Molybdopterin-dependent oxidoreductase-like protein n=1 Tax=Lapillicoccus jejuensis TaxID=402171 RepID=A0A542E5Z4_9MICO|nr:molybdopterin-dependent oxidoreductase [Lapillicoccus jejuensis]TQJ10743.1 molybdopterin-dependent oxidoreductase-like protein [Lapillicoccus jejuensis]
MGRWSNLALAWLVPLAVLTGFVTFAVGDAGALPAAVLHGATALAVLALVPWKSAVVRRGLRRARPGRSTSLVLTALTLLALATGVLHVLGVLGDGLPVTVMQAHVGAGLVAVAFVVAHAHDRRVRARREDALSRRGALRVGGVLLAGAAGSAALLTGGAGVAAAGTRRSTGSFRLDPDTPQALPATTWLLDTVPAVDEATWRLTVVAGGRERAWSVADLAPYDDAVTAVLDCTSGWWSRQTWQGVRLARLLPPGTSTSSGTVLVTSVTGYSRRLPLTDDLLLARRVGGRDLAPGTGWPARLVVPGRRGHHWVKWVQRVEVVDGPWWAQTPLPWR